MPHGYMKKTYLEGAAIKQPQDIEFNKDFNMITESLEGLNYYQNGNFIS